MSLPKETLGRVVADAKNHTTKSGLAQREADILYTGYVEGAFAEANRSQKLVACLEFIKMNSLDGSHFKIEIDKTLTEYNQQP
jgi:hypothetical protein